MTTAYTIDQIKERVRAVLEKEPERKDSLKEWLHTNGWNNVSEIPTGYLWRILNFIRSWEEVDGIASPLKLTEKVGPIREFRRQEIVEGSFGLLTVASSFVTTADIRVQPFTADFDNLKNIRELIGHLTSIADFLEADDASAAN